MPAVTYDITTKANGTFTVKYNTANPSIWTRGSTATYTFEFPQFAEDLVVSDSYTVGGVEGYNSVTVQSGATLTIPSGSLLQAGELTDNGTVTVNGTLSVASRFKDLLGEYVEYAGKYSPTTMLSGKERYRVNIPDNIGISSLVWGVQPSQHIRDQGQPGVWGLVDAVNSERTAALNTYRFSVELFVLGRYSEYAGVADVENNLLM